MSGAVHGGVCRGVQGVQRGARSVPAGVCRDVTEVHEGVHNCVEVRTEVTIVHIVHRGYHLSLATIGCP